MCPLMQGHGPLPCFEVLDTARATTSFSRGPCTQQANPDDNFLNNVNASSSTIQSHPALCDRVVKASNLHLLQRCCCRVGVRPGQEPPGTTGLAPPRSPAEETIQDNTGSFNTRTTCLFWASPMNWLQLIQIKLR